MLQIKFINNEQADKTKQDFFHIRSHFKGLAFQLCYNILSDSQMFIRRGFIFYLLLVIFIHKMASNHDFYSQKTSFIIPQISSEYNNKLISCQVQNPYTRLYNNTGNSASSQRTVYCKQSPILKLNFFRKEILHKSMIS